MAESFEPAAKRRRVESTPRPHDGYISFSQGSVQLTFTTLPPIEPSFDLPNFPLQVKVRNLVKYGGLFVEAIVPGQSPPSLPKVSSKSSGGDELYVEASVPSQRTPWIFRVQAPVSGDDRQRLDYAARLAPFSEHTPDSKKPSDVCSSVSLDKSTGDPESMVWTLNVEVLIKERLDPLTNFTSTAHDQIFRELNGEDLAFTGDEEEWNPRDFYESVHVPEKTQVNSADLPIGLLQSTLFPFQRRAVRWLLSREGIQVERSGRLLPLQAPDAEPALPLGFFRRTTSSGYACIINPTLGVITQDIAAVQSRYGLVKGGILAEEMGLGKTVELLALLCLHKRPAQIGLSDSPAAMKGPTRPSAATLIITPPAILEQWKQEINEHAPSLHVYHYTGLKSTTKGGSEAGLIDDLASSDIVLTTYNIISKEIHYVADKRDRNLRSKPRYEAPKCPLVQIEWWRVCLDEAQMIENGVSAAATVARLIPRINAWAVSGTPLKLAHKDLYGLLLFLQYQPWCYSLRLWNRLVGCYRPLFRTLMGEIAIRHSKDFVREDLRLPPQTRQVITIPFTPIEEQYYGQLRYRMCEEIALDRDGAPLAGYWDPNDPTTVEAMRIWLTRLRQTCLHPEIGARNRRSLGRGGGPLRSMQQVLDIMIDQQDMTVRHEQRTLLVSQIRRGQMMENAKDTNAALQIWQTAYEEACKIVVECRTQLAAVIPPRRELAEEDPNGHDASDEDESEADSSLVTYRQRLRSALEVKHICIFFIANAYFQMKSDEEVIKADSEEFKQLQDKEESAYEEAKSIRAELLAEVLKKVNKLILSIRTKAEGIGFVELPDMELTLDYTGIESRKVFEKLDLYCRAMNEQGKKLREFRQKLAEFLRQSLIDEDEGVELQGDEYESSTKHQDEMYAYMEAFRAMYADRSDALTGQENTLIKHEMKQLLRSAKNGEGPAPEVMIRLLGERDAHRVPTNKLGSLRGIITEVRSLMSALQWQEGSARAQAELQIATNILTHAQQLITLQTKSIAALEQEVEQFRDTMNSRLDYYRALQKISDTVAPFEEENIGNPVDMVAYNLMLVEEERKDGRLATLLSRRRYYEHLKIQETIDTSARICIICRDEFEIGTLTSCGHTFCKECIRFWWDQHRSCPVCKKRLSDQDFWDITYKPAEMAVKEESPAFSPTSPGSDRSLNKSIYSDISTATLNQIKDVELNGQSFGSKVDTVCRHLFWLRDHDAGSKAIIFSQFREFLDVLGRAFKQYKIGFTRFDDKNGIEQFKNDPAVECFLLHAKAHATGLNLVVANHVFLCEPLINPAIELQAIARVHRIGQRRATTVWMYLVADTVEERIYEISVTRRLAHAKSKTFAAGESSRSGTATPNHNGVTENAIDVANSLELQSADLSKLLTTGKSGGEVVGKKDLWQCLFGKVEKRKATGVVPTDHALPDSVVASFLRVEAAENRRTLVER